MARVTPAVDPLDPPRKENAADLLPEQHIKVVSVEGVDASEAAPKANMTAEDMLAEIERLRGQVAAEALGRSEAEKALADSMTAEGYITGVHTLERPTGKFVTVKRSTGLKVVGYHDDGRDILRAEFGPVELPTYMYRVDLPPCGGTDMKINGVPLYHGSIIETDIDTLRTVKDMVYRIWLHDAEINGRNENAFGYRKEQAPVLSARGMR